jgi:hypothetical protein
MGEWAEVAVKSRRRVVEGGVSGSLLFCLSFVLSSWLACARLAVSDLPKTTHSTSDIYLVGWIFLCVRLSLIKACPE